MFLSCRTCFGIPHDWFGILCRGILKQVQDDSPMLLLSNKNQAFMFLLCRTCFCTPHDWFGILCRGVLKQVQDDSPMLLLSPKKLLNPCTFCTVLLYRYKIYRHKRSIVNFYNDLFKLISLLQFLA